MTTLALDTFTGALDTEIASPARVPDGGGTPALAVGEWTRVTNSPGDGTFDIVAVPVVQGPDETATNNAASKVVTLPPYRPVGSFLGIAVYSRDSVARHASTPTGWAVAQEASGAGKLWLFWRTCDGTEADTVTITFTGAGAAGVDQLYHSFVIEDVTGSPLGTIGTASSWLSADNLGPIQGITPSAADSVILMLGAKQNDFNGLPTATGFELLKLEQGTAGNDAGLAIMFQLQSGGPTVIPNTTIVDSGATASLGAGVGFMLELLRSGASDNKVVQRTPTGLQDWNHYVLADVPGIDGVGVDVDGYMVEGTFRVHNAEGWVGVIARHDEVLETGYEIDVIPFGGSSCTLDMEYVWNGVHTLLRSVPLTIDFTEPVKLRLCISGPSTDVNLAAYVNDVRIIPDDGTLDPLGTYIHNPPSGQEVVGGWPGACLNDGTRTGLAMEMTRFLVSDTCEEYPCEGDPDNPYPWEPVPPPDEPVIPPVWVMKYGIWREVDVPSPITDKVSGQGNASPRIVNTMAIEWDGIWRYPGDPGMDSPPFPETPLPPFFDPCLLVPELPPPVPGDLIPLTSRFFGMNQMPMGIMGPLFTGTQNATGPWFSVELPQAVSKGVTIIGAQGGSSGIKGPGSTWDLTTFINGTIDKISPVYSLLVTHTALGSFFGYSMMDDFESHRLWAPSGVPIGEMITALNTLRATFPDIRWGIRARPSQFSSNPGFDFYSCQYKSWISSPSAFGATEYALAASRSAYIKLDLNYLHGGDGSSGIRYDNGTQLGQSEHNFECSAAEVAYYFPQMYAGAQSVDTNVSWLAGSTGYTYDPDYLTRPGMIDAFVVARNALASLPQLP